MRALHRIVAILSCVAMLYVGLTGAAMQIIDLAAISRALPETHPVVQSMNEGRFGNADYEVVTPGDFAAMPLPRNFDFGAAFAKTLAVTRHGRKTPPGSPSWRCARRTAGL